MVDNSMLNSVKWATRLWRERVYRCADPFAGVLLNQPPLKMGYTSGCATTCFPLLLHHHRSPVLLSWPALALVCSYEQVIEGAGTTDVPLSEFGVLGQYPPGQLLKWYQQESTLSRAFHVSWSPAHFDTYLSAPPPPLPVHPLTPPSTHQPLAPLPPRFLPPPCT